MTGNVFYTVAAEETATGAITVQGINRMPVTGGPETRVVDGVFNHPELSADGKWLVAEGPWSSAGDSTVVYARADGLGPVSHLANGYRSPTANADGTRIAAVVSAGSGRIDILDRAGAVTASYTYPADGSTYWLSVAWSPDGQRLAATTDNGIYTIDVATGAYTRISGFGQVPWFAWTSDSEGVAYVLAGDVTVVDVLTFDANVVASGLNGARCIRFSRDGSAVMASVMDGQNHGQIARLNLDSSEEQIFTPADHFRFGCAT